MGVRLGGPRGGPTHTLWGIRVPHGWSALAPAHASCRLASVSIQHVEYMKKYMLFQAFSRRMLLILLHLVAEW